MGRSRPARTTTRVLTSQGYHVHRAIAIPDPEAAIRAPRLNPFAETRELVAGFWLWEVKDMGEAVAWVKRCPNPMPGPSEIEIRPLYEMADLRRDSDAGGHGNP